MPVYNGERYLREAVESILGQTWSDFEFLVVDDGSTDASAAIVESYADERIRLVRNGRNLGLIAALNKGLETARGRYVARMDADDVSLPRRLERQVAYMERNPEVCVAGSYCRVIDETGRSIRTFVPEPRGFLLSFRMHVEGLTPVYHPTVMFRTGPIREQGGYSPDFPHAEDGALWFRLNAAGRSFANIPEVLVLYRSHGGQITQTRSDEQIHSHARAYARFLSSFLAEPIEAAEVVGLAPRWFGEECIRGPAELEQLLSFKRRIALRFFDAARLADARIVACVAHLWSSLLCLRKVNPVRKGYVRRLSRYCLGVLREALKTESGIRRILYECLFIVYLARVIPQRLWSKAWKRTR